MHKKMPKNTYTVHVYMYKKRPKPTNYHLFCLNVSVTIFEFNPLIFLTKYLQLVYGPHPPSD